MAGIESIYGKTKPVAPSATTLAMMPHSGYARPFMAYVAGQQVGAEADAAKAEEERIKGALQSEQAMKMMKEIRPIITKAIDVGDYGTATHAYNQIASYIGAPEMKFMGAGKQGELYWKSGADGQTYVGRKKDVDSAVKTGIPLDKVMQPWGGKPEDKPASFAEKKWAATREDEVRYKIRDGIEKSTAAIATIAKSSQDKNQRTLIDLFLSRHDNNSYKDAIKDLKDPKNPLTSQIQEANKVAISQALTNLKFWQDEWFRVTGEKAPDNVSVPPPATPAVPGAAPMMQPPGPKPLNGRSVKINGKVIAPEHLTEFKKTKDGRQAVKYNGDWYIIREK